MKNNQKNIPNVPHSKHLLNDHVALIRAKDEVEPKLKISFDYYNSNLCEIEDLQISPARKCLMKFKQIGQSTPKTLFENNVRSEPVRRTGRYLELFSKLSDDVDLFEIDIGSASRLFYFTVGYLVHVVSIKNSHFKY